MEAPVDAVTAAEIIRNFGYWQQQALARPLTVTHHGRARTMLISTDHFEDLTASVASPAEANHAVPDLLACLLANSVSGFMVVDSDLQIRDANHVVLGWLGKTLEEIRGRPANHLGPLANQLFGSMLRRVFRSGEALSYEINGQTTKMRLSVRSFPFGNYVACVANDITEQEILRDDSDRLDGTTLGLGLLDMLATAEIDGDGRISRFSEVLERMTASTASNLEGVKLVDLLDPPGRADAIAALSAAMADGKVSRIDAALLGHGGAPKAVSLSVVPLARGLTGKGAVVAISQRLAMQHGGYMAAGAT